MGSGGQHADYLEAWFRACGGLKVVAPSNPADAYGLMLSCIERRRPLSVYRAPGELLAPGAPRRAARGVPIGKANVVLAGSACDLDQLQRNDDPLRGGRREAGKGRDKVELIDLRTISAWDTETVLTSWLKPSGRSWSIEAVRSFGVGAEIAATVNERLFGALKAPVQRIGAAYCAVPFSKPLETAFVPSQAQIETAVKEGPGLAVHLRRLRQEWKTRR